MIHLINLHYDNPIDFEYIGRAHARKGLRASPLANPIPITADRSRAEAVQQYQDWLAMELLTPFSAAHRELDRLTELAMQGDLTLACWCAPKLCHGNVIRNIITTRLRARIEASLKPSEIKGYLYIPDVGAYSSYDMVGERSASQVGEQLYQPAVSALPFHIGQTYQREAAEPIACTQCNATAFEVGIGPHFTAIRCGQCGWEVCIHDG